MLSGIERGVVWAPELDERHTSGLFAFAIMLGVVLTATAAALAFPLSAFFHRPDLTPVVISLSPLMLISSFGLTSSGLLRRRMSFAPVAAADTLGYMVGYVVVGLAAARAGLGVYSLVLATLTQSLVQATTLYVSARHAIGRRWKFSQILPILSFSFKVSGVGVLEYLSLQMPVFFAGKMFGMDLLGIYNRSYALIQMPVEQLGTAMNRVLFSSFNKAKVDVSSLGRAVRGSLQFLGAVILPVSLGIAAAAPQITAVVLGSKWPGADHVMSILAVGSAAMMLANLLAVMSEATARIAAKAVIQLTFMIVLVAGLFGFKALTIEGVALAFSVGRVVYLCLHLRLASRQIDTSVWRLAGAFIPGMTAAVLVAAVLLALPHLVADAQVRPDATAADARRRVGDGRDLFVRLPEIRTPDLATIGAAIGDAGGRRPARPAASSPAAGLRLAPAMAVDISGVFGG